MSDPRRNAEHYMDMTAYLAIRNAERELGMLPKNGEVWKVDYQGVERMVVVVAAHEGYCTVLLLNDERKSENDVGLAIGNNMYTDPGKLAYRYNNIFTERVMRLPNDEFSILISAVTDALCIYADKMSDKMEDLRQQIAVLEHGAEEYEMVIDKLQDQIRSLNCELESRQQPLLVSSDVAMAALQAERDVYKEAYHAIIEKLTERR